MSTNKLSHLKDGDKIYLEVTREKSHFEDNEIGLHFCKSLNSSIWVNDDDTFYTLDDLKQLANDGMPAFDDEEISDTNRIISGKEAKIVIDGKEYTCVIK